ncbi:hypothetical protein [Shewanella sediminis]|uniref:hypothetical protein n=1 Tax=Shewanella sediminis TaxID=271097 RepID=UPI0002D3C699|nr:hypothetical protein [Shewanella sediminis]
MYSIKLISEVDNPSVGAAVGFDDRDVIVETIGTYLRRPTEVPAHKPAAGD